MDTKQNSLKELKHIWLYAIKLDDGKFYVGITARADPIKRIQQHINGEGAKWTKLHEPVEVLEIQDLGIISWEEAKAIEHNWTADYVYRYGMKNVRGGYITYTGKVYLMFGRYIPDYKAEILFTVLFLLFVIAFLAFELELRK